MSPTSFRVAPIRFWLASLLIASPVLPLVSAEKANRATSERWEKPTAALEAAARAPKAPPTTAAADLPAEITLLSDVKQDCRWTLVGHNEKAQEHEKLHPQFNAVRAVWHCPLASNRQVFKFEFTRPVRKGGNVLHLYVKADGDESTGRKNAGVHNGVDYMFTLIDGDPQHASTRLDVIDDGGKSRRGFCTIVISGATLYVAAEMTLRQQDGHSVFEYSVASYVTGKGPSVGLPYRRVDSAPAPKAVETAVLQNAGMVAIKGIVPGWQLVGGSRPIEAKIAADGKGGVVVENLFSPEGLLQIVHLTPGHYLLRALARTNVFQIHVVAESARLPVAVSDEHRWVELPFCVPLAGGDALQPTQVGFRYLARPATGNASRLPARLAVKKVELVRLGDTVLKEKWAETLPVDRLHRLKAIAESPAWSRPGKVIFQDSLVGTELWLLTQEGKVDHTYVGHPNFSHEGKYLHIGFRRPPRGLLRTDGSARYLNGSWSGIVWPFPWEQKRLPAGTDPADWIVTARGPGGIQLHNVVTHDGRQIELPSRPGWRIVHFPGIATYGGRGPNMLQITHETLVWFSDDKRSVGRSHVSGERFTTFPLRSISSQPADDTLHADMSSVGGKAGDNWRDAVDRIGNRYFLFELNRDRLPNDPANPYQVWALSLNEGDHRGLLRVVFHPAATMKEFVTSQTGMRPQPSANWWNFAAGFPWSGDNAMLLLEDGTIVHMSSLGMHSSFAGGSTVSVNDIDCGQTRYVSSYPKFDRVSWPHEFRRDRDYAVVASHAEPASPLVMIDLEHTAIWTLALTNFHDYSMRYRTRWDPKAYHKPMFRPAPGFSPDFTKVVFFSSMLTGDDANRPWGDVYVAVARYPEPPRRLRQEGAALVWEEPQRHAEVRGFRLYRSDESGRGYARVGTQLLTDTRYELPPGAEGCYVLTSVEHSGLEGRVFSNEVRVGRPAVFRHFYRLAAGRIVPPMVPLFEPAGTAAGYAVAITDPDLIYQQRLAQGLTGTVTTSISIPEAAAIRILVRVRGMSTMERATYTTGWAPSGETGRGRFTVRVDRNPMGTLAVEGRSWRWVTLDATSIHLAAGEHELQFSTSDAGIAIDSVVVTNDPGFAPRGRGQVSEEVAAVPQRLRTASLSPHDEPAIAGMLKEQRPRVKLAWDAVAAPQGVVHYNVYRSDRETFEADPETLLGSPTTPVFHDIVEPGREVYYRVHAVDAWGNRSPASPVLAVTQTATKG